MAGAITYDTVGSSFTSGIDGDSWNRRYLITGMTGGPDIPTLIVEAYALIPDNGTPAPAPIPNQFLREATIDRIWCDPETNLWSAEGTIIYTTPARRVGGLIGVPDDNGPAINITGSSAAVEIETDKDNTGAQIITTYDNVDLAHVARTFEVARNLTLGRIETQQPYSRKDTVEGKLNDALWNGYAAGTVLCANIAWDSDDGGTSWLVEYSFAIRDSWEFEATHEDPFFPGRPLPGAIDPARKKVDVIPRANFGVLNLTLP